MKRTARNSREELMYVASVHDSVGPCSPDRTTRSVEAHLHGEKRFCIYSGSSFSAGSPFMVEMRAVEPDCVRDPRPTQDRTKSSTHCLSEQTILLEFRDGMTSSTSVLLMTNIAVSSSNMSPSQKNANAAAVASSRAPLRKPTGPSISGARGVKLTLFLSQWLRFV